VPGEAVPGRGVVQRQETASRPEDRTGYLIAVARVAGGFSGVAFTGDAFFVDGEYINSRADRGRLTMRLARCWSRTLSVHFRPADDRRIAVVALALRIHIECWA
jgi:hypothetical protein